MGLDVVELLMDVEDTFGIVITDDDYVQIRTAGDLHEYIVARLEKERELQLEDPRCRSFPPFFAIRNGLTSLFDVDRRDVRPRTRLEKILPYARRRKLWKRLRATTQIRLPALKLSAPLSCLVMLLGLVIVVSTFARALHLFDGGVVLLGIPIVLITFSGLYFATRPFSLAFPERCSTVADAVRFAGPPHYHQLRPSPWIGVDRQQVWDELRQIVSEQLGVPPSDVTPDASFVDDLKFD